MIQFSFVPDILRSGRATARRAGVGLAAVLLGLAGCAEYDSSVGESIVGESPAGVIKERSIPVEATATQVAGDIFKRSDTPLVLGQQDSMRSHIFMQYTAWDALGDTVLQIHGAEVMLFGNSFVDSQRVEDFSEWEAEILRVDQWFDLLELEYGSELELTPIDTARLGTNQSLDSTSFALDLQTLEGWIRDTLDFGLYIRPLEEEATFLKRFSRGTFDAAQIPALRVEADVQVGDEVFNDTTIHISPSYATYLVDDRELPGDEGYLYLSEGYQRRMLFKGDFSELDPAYYSLNRVDLVVHVAPEWPGFLGNTGFFTWYDLENSDWLAEPDSAKLGNPSSLAFSIPEDSLEIRLNITPIARYWVSQPDSNFGLAVRSVIEGNGVSRAAFTNIAGTHADPDRVPYFRVYYTEFEEP